MKTRPILFNGPMVRALLDGSKTQTRRAVKSEAPDEANGACWVDIDGRPVWQWVENGDEQDTIAHAQPFTCPYGQPGDRLWVRETFFAFGRWETRFSTKKGRDEWHFVDMTAELGKSYVYAADGFPEGYAKHHDGGRGGVTPTWWKRPAIFMPRWASRITLEITCVRVARLQEISDEDSLEEGVYPMATGLYPGSPRAAYQKLWESINGPGSWSANPWVWVVQFKQSINGAAQ